MIVQKRKSEIKGYFSLHESYRGVRLRGKKLANAPRISDKQQPKIVTTANIVFVLGLVFLLVNGCAEFDSSVLRSAYIDESQDESQIEVAGTYWFRVHGPDGELISSYHNRITDVDKEEKEIFMFGDLPLHVWGSLAKLQRIDIQRVVVGHVIEEDELTFASVPGTEIHRNELYELCRDGLVSSGYEINLNSKLSLSATYKEKICLHATHDKWPSRVILGDGSQVPNINVIKKPNISFIEGDLRDFTSEISKHIIFSLELSHDDHGTVRDIRFQKYLGVSESPLKMLNSLLSTQWPFATGKDVFIKMLKDTNADIRISAAKTLATVYAKAAGLDTFTEMLSHSDPDIRKIAARTMGNRYTDKPNKAIPVLMQVSEKDEHWYVRRAAGIALQRIRMASSPEDNK